MKSYIIGNVADYFDVNQREVFYFLDAKKTTTTNTDLLEKVLFVIRRFSTWR